MKRRGLDAYSGAGGICRGYQLADFHMTGVDNRPQPNYCGDEFIQADALEVLADREFLAGFDFVHASPPCNDHIRSGMTPIHGTGWLLAATRELLEASGLLWVIENVPGAPLRPDLILCGCMFGLELRRERWFETSWHAFDLRPACHHQEPPVGVYGHPRGGQPGKTWGWGTYEDWCRAMRIDWMTADELAQAIPPPYGEYIGRRALEVLEDAARSMA
jgi:hypothetical protein